MKDLLEVENKLAGIILSAEQKRKNVGDWIKQAKTFIQPVYLNPLDNCIVGVDGGMVKKSFHGVDLILLRAIAVAFYYKNNKLSSTDYYPSSLPPPEPRVVIDPFSDIEFEVNSNIERQIKEVEIACEALKKFSPDTLLLHGSIIPHYTFVPEKTSILFANYKRMIEAYQNLFDAVKSTKTILAGVVEDSRGTRFCELIYDSIPQDLKLILNRSKDSNILAYALSRGERTVSFKYSSDAKKHPILRNFSDAERIQTFYIKLGEMDRPIRVDFLADKPNADSIIASSLLSCTYNTTYTIPPVLVEADQRAKIEEKTLDDFYRRIAAKVGYTWGMLNLRRDNRPF